jgi:copper transport protein
MTLVKDRPRGKAKSARRQPITGRVVACLLLVLVAWGTVFALASPASHDVPVLRSTTPGVGSNIRPDDLVLTFDRPVDAGLATVLLTDPYRRPVDPGRPFQVDGRAETVAVSLPEQKYAGTYAVAWRVPAGAAVARGTFTFDLASRSPAWPAPELPGTQDISRTVARIGGLVMLALLASVALHAAVTGVTAARLATVAWLGSVAGTLVELFGFGAGTTLFARLALLGLTGLPLAQLMTVGPPRDARERWLRAGTVLGCTAAVAATWTFAALPVSAPLLLGSAVLLTALVVLPGAALLLGPRWPTIAAAGITTVALAAAVVVTQPAAAVSGSAPARVPFDGGQGFADLVVAPARVGANQVYVTVLGRDDAPRRDVSYTAVLNPPGGKGKPVPVRDGAVRIPGPGEWELALTIRSARGEETIYGVVDVPD